MSVTDIFNRPAFYFGMALGFWTSFLSVGYSSTMSSFYTKSLTFKYVGTQSGF
jgi:hypothetical protein